jgi:hypothetical protein
MPVTFTQQKNKPIDLAHTLKKLLIPHSYKIDLLKNTKNNIDFMLIPRNRINIYNIIKSMGVIKAYGDIQMFAVIDKKEVNIFFSDWYAFNSKAVVTTYKEERGKNNGGRQKSICIAEKSAGCTVPSKDGWVSGYWDKPRQ